MPHYRESRQGGRINRSWKQITVGLAGAGVSLLPKLACPLCWPAYAGLLSSIGLGFLISTKYLLPVTAASLVLALGALAFRAKSRQGYGPFVVGLVAAVGVLVGKFEWESNPTLYGAVGLLVITSVWNVWPRQATACSTLTEKSLRKKGVLRDMAAKKRVEIFSAGCLACEEAIEMVMRLAVRMKS
jgi:mercuric ion transport protein